MAKDGCCFCIFLLMLSFVSNGFTYSSNSQNSSSNSVEQFFNISTKDPWNTTCNGSLSECDKRDSPLPPPTTVEEFCVYMRISPVNCSCEKSSKVCEMERYIRYLLLGEDYKLAVSIEVTTALVLGVVGNSAVLLSSFQRRNKLSTNKIVIAFLALTDGISSVLNFVNTLPLIIWSVEKWTFGVPLCRITLTGMMACSWLSSGFILLVGVERYFGILYPLRRSLYSKKTVFGCVVMNVIVVLCAGIPMLIYTGINENGACHLTARKDILIPYQWVLMVLFMVLPMSAVVFIYFRIIFHLHRSTHHNVSIQGRDDIRLKRVKENRRAMMILLSIVIAFITCVLPVHVIDLYFVYYKWDGVVEVDYFLYLDLWLVLNLSYPLHACVNPIIYTSVDPEFRRSLRSVCGLRQRHGSQSSDSNTQRLSVTTSF